MCTVICLTAKLLEEREEAPMVETLQLSTKDCVITDYRSANSVDGDIDPKSERKSAQIPYRQKTSDNYILLNISYKQ